MNPLLKPLAAPEARTLNKGRSYSRGSRSYSRSRSCSRSRSHSRSFSGRRSHSRSRSDAEESDDDGGLKPLAFSELTIKACKDLLADYGIEEISAGKGGNKIPISECGTHQKLAMQALLRTVIQRQQPIDLEPADVAADANGMPTLERYSELEKFDEIQIDALYAIARLERAVRAQTGAVQLGGPPGAEKKLRDASNLIQRA